MNDVIMTSLHCVRCRSIWDALSVSRGTSVLSQMSASTIAVRTHPILDLDLWIGHVSLSDVTGIHLHGSARTRRNQGNECEWLRRL